MHAPGHTHTPVPVTLSYFVYHTKVQVRVSRLSDIGERPCARLYMYLISITSINLVYHTEILHPKYECRILTDWAFGKTRRAYV